MIWAREHADDPVGHHIGATGRTGRTAHDDELVAADPHDLVPAPERVAEPIGDRHEHLVARGVAVLVVHRREPVEVDVEHAGHVVVGRRHELLQTGPGSRVRPSIVSTWSLTSRIV
ncbi:MAG: hypothetical protein WD225_00780, partial [Ilumatobacteraceae bacterium]